MVSKTIFEKGDSLESLAYKARDWFNENNVEVPSCASNWQRASVQSGEIPPGTGVGSLRRYGFNVTAFISAITDNPSLKPYNHDPIHMDNISDILGLDWITSRESKGHKWVLTKCNNCNREEEITYGTLQRMKKANNKFCRYCRSAGGKPKDLIIYNKFKNFTVLEKIDDRFRYSCHTCNGIIERNLTHVGTAEYLVCELCEPWRNFGARQYTELGYFDSKIEYEAYKILLQYLPSDYIVRQKKYDDLFNTGTNHTADFYIPKANLILEITSRYNKLGDKYKEVAKWKTSLSDNVKFAYSLKEVEDIVRPIAKALGITVSYRRNVLRCGIEPR